MHVIYIYIQSDEETFSWTSLNRQTTESDKQWKSFPLQDCVDTQWDFGAAI